ncbi:hypothetical protein Ancab_004221, partial [Ancistrocladus abbreviatus]
AKEAGAAEGSGGPGVLSRVGWAGLGFGHSPKQTSEASEDSNPPSGGIYIDSKRQLQHKDSTVKLRGSRKKMKSKKKKKAKATQDTQVEGSGGTQWQGQTASPAKPNREDRHSAVVQNGEITISGNHISDGGIQNMNRLFLRKQECDDASFV